MSKAKKGIAVVAACAVVIAVAVSTLGATSAVTTEAPQEVDNRARVETRLPEIGNIVVQGEFIGTVDPDQQVTIYPKASGEVLSVNYSVGDTVEAGDILIEIDSEALRLSIAQTQATISSAEAKAEFSLSMAEKKLENQEYNIDEGIDAEILQAEAAIKTAENTILSCEHEVSNTRRDIRDLRDDKLQVPDGSSYDEYIEAKQRLLSTAEVKLEGAQTALQQAQTSLEALRELKKQQTASEQDNVELAKLNTDFSDQRIAVQKLQNDLKNYTVRAPISGVIEQRNIDPYGIASPSGPVFVISNKDVMNISFNVSETTLDHMQIGDKVTLDKNGVTFEGTISEINTMVNAQSGLYTIKAMVENPPVSLHSGSSVKVFAETQKAENEILVPIDFLYYDGGAPYVYIAENGVARKVFVETGIANDESIQILSGISKSDQIITTWNSNLADGAEIVLRGEESGANDSPAAVTSEAEESSADESTAASAPAEGEESEVDDSPAASTSESEEAPA